MGPPPSGADPGGEGLVVPLAGWGRTRFGRYIAAAMCIGGGIALAGAIYLIALMFSVWGSGPGRGEALFAFASIAGGVVLAGVVLWPILGSEGPRLVLGDRSLRFHHPDLASDLVVDRSDIVAIHVDHIVGSPVFAHELGLSAFGGANLAMVFRTPQRMPRVRFASDLNPFFSMRTGRTQAGLRLRVADVEWARQVFGTMPQYRAITDEDYARAGVKTRHLEIPQVVLIAIAAVAFAGQLIFRLLS